MIDHIGFPVSDYQRAKAFYTRALAPLGYSLVMEVTQQQTGHDPAAGFGANGKPDLWIGGEGGLNKPVHVAILAKDRSAVDAFYEAAIAAGGRDNGAPGIRAHYHPDYYGAFVLDPDGSQHRSGVSRTRMIRFHREHRFAGAVIAPGFMERYMVNDSTAADTDRIREITRKIGYVKMAATAITGTRPDFGDCRKLAL
jgi:catechol 2,3-dioxygenase-like lactoylglutathione lyase family enzyme